MILNSFTALTVSNLNNGTTTFPITHEFPHAPAQAARLPLIGGAYFNMYAGGVAPRVAPSSPWVARYKFKGATHELLMNHINTLEVFDKGKTGTLTWSGEHGVYPFTAVGVLHDIGFEQAHPGNFEATISLTIEILTPIQQAT